MAHNIEQSEKEVKNLKFDSSVEKYKNNLVSISKSEESKSSGSSSSSSSSDNLEMKAIHSYLESGDVQA